MRNQRANKRKNSKFPLLAILFSAIALVLVIMSFLLLSKDQECVINYEGEHLDSRATKIKRHFWEKDTKNDKDNFSYEIETELNFKGEEQECKIDLANPHCNTLLMYVELSLEDEEVFFTSGLIRPGEKIEKITPDKKLPEGDFKGYAVICAVDPETEEFTGFLEQQVNIRVRK